MKYLIEIGILSIVFISGCLSSTGRHSAMQDAYSDELYKQYIEDEYRRESFSDQQIQHALYEYYNEISDLKNDCKRLARECGESAFRCSTYGYTYYDYYDLQQEYEKLENACTRQRYNYGYDCPLDGYGYPIDENDERCT